METRFADLLAREVLRATQVVLRMELLELIHSARCQK